MKCLLNLKLWSVKSMKDRILRRKTWNGGSEKMECLLKKFFNKKSIRFSEI